jgi:hypothetical protein
MIFNIDSSRPFPNDVVMQNTSCPVWWLDDLHRSSFLFCWDNEWHEYIWKGEINLASRNFVGTTITNCTKQSQKGKHHVPE